MRNSIKNISRYITILLVFIQSFAQAQDTLDVGKIEKGVDKYLTYFSGDNPGAVVAVMKKGEVIFNKAYGLADVEKKKAMSNDMLFNMDQLSKSFTAIAVLKLVEKQKLSLDDNLKYIFPDFPDYGRNITVQNILAHKSGLPNYDTGKEQSNNDVYNFLVKQDSAIFKPGSKFIYSNSDYPILVKVIEKSANMSYQDFLKKYVFKKLKMNNTFFMDEVRSKNIASAHFKLDGDYVINNYQFKGVYGEQGIFTNAADYAKYDKALYTNKLLKCENLKKVFRVEKLSNKENVSDYASGWALMAKGGIRYFWQGAMGNGYTNLVLHLPDTQTTVLILTNRNDGYDFLKMAIYIAKLFDKDLKL